MLVISGMKAQQDIVSQLGPDLAWRRKLRSFVIFVFRYRSINRKLYEVAFGSFYARSTLDKVESLNVRAYISVPRYSNLKNK